jgi:tetratricopeptide (TPR) repeat protein
MKMTSCILNLTFLWFCSCQNSTSQRDAKQDETVFRDQQGHTLSKTELDQATGQVNYEIVDNQTINPAARILHQEARQLGQASRYDEAIVKLHEAIKLQPDWAYPAYDLAFTYLLKGDNANALKFYQKTDELEPKGFFTSKTALYTLEGEKSGKFPPGLYTTYLQIEWTNDAAKKLEIAKLITQKVPDFAPAWKEVAMLVEDSTEKMNAIEKGLSKNPDQETKGILLINQAILLNNEGKQENAKEILGNLIFSPHVTRGNLELAKFTLKSITQKS